jgi:MSHA pilin protein MshD
MRKAKLMAFLRRSTPARRGFTMAEIVVSTAIIGVMIVAALDAVGMAARTRRLNADRLAGEALAQELMAEVMSMPYTDPESPGGAIGFDSGESSANRSTFDDVDDYHNYSATSVQSRSGDVYSGYTNWGQQVTVTYADRTTAAASGSDTGLKRITVTVTSPTFETTQLIALRSNSGALEQTLPLAGTAVSCLGAKLRTGSSARSQYVAFPTLNHAPDAN